jgi:uncharacterized protein YgbK (DUF1537 family)
VSELTALADDLTGACDVAAELAAAGRRVRVVVAPDGAAPAGDDAITIVNTQSRALAPAAAAERVRAALAPRPASLVLKKIDTALRGHLGAELDAALDVVRGPAFVLAAIPAAGRVTRDGCQWFGDRLLAATEFARDPEGPGAVSSIPEVLARESGRRAAVIGRDVVRAGALAAEVGRHARAGVEVFVVDAETEDDVHAAVVAILALPRPLCLVGSIALAAAVARRVAPRGRAIATPARREPPARPGTAPPSVPLPALVVNGSLHSRARAQAEAVLATGRAVAVSVPAADDAAALATTAAAAATALAGGASVVLAPLPSSDVPTGAALRATERALADAVAAIAARTRVATLVLIGGETSYAILDRLGAGAIAVEGRVAPLIARGTVLSGTVAGATVITKGGSGGEVDVVAALVAGAAKESA